MRFTLSIPEQIVRIGADAHGHLRLVLTASPTRFMDELWFGIPARVRFVGTGVDEMWDNSPRRDHYRCNSMRYTQDEFREQTRGEFSRQRQDLSMDEGDTSMRQTRVSEKMWGIVGENGRKCIISNTFYS